MDPDWHGSGLTRIRTTNIRTNNDPDYQGSGSATRPKTQIIFPLSHHDRGVLCHFYAIFIECNTVIVAICRKKIKHSFANKTDFHLSVSRDADKMRQKNSVNIWVKYNICFYAFSRGDKKVFFFNFYFLFTYLSLAYVINNKHTRNLFVHFTGTNVKICIISIETKFLYE